MRLSMSVALVLVQTFSMSATVCFSQEGIPVGKFSQVAKPIEDDMRPDSIPELPSALTEVPSADGGDFRLYLNSRTTGPLGYTAVQELEKEKQKDGGQVIVPVIREEKSEVGTWSGSAFFSVEPVQIEAWIRLDMKEATTKNPVFDIHITVGDKELAPLTVSLSEEDVKKIPDKELQVLVRSALTGVQINKGDEIRISFTGDSAQKLLVKGVGFSHIEFYADPNKRCPYQAVFGVRDVLAENLKSSDSFASSNGTPASIPKKQSNSNTFRLWTDSTGTYHLKAKMQVIMIRLEKEGGGVIDIPINKLSPNDKSFILNTMD